MLRYQEFLLKRHFIQANEAFMNDLKKLSALFVSHDFIKILKANLDVLHSNDSIGTCLQRITINERWQSFEFAGKPANEFVKRLGWIKSEEFNLTSLHSFVVAWILFAFIHSDIRSKNFQEMLLQLSKHVKGDYLLFSLMRTKLKSHPESDYNSIVCALCFSVIDVTTVIEHLTAICCNRFIRCENECDFLHTKRSLYYQRHKIICPNKEISCTNGCGDVLMQKDLLSHLGELCKKREIFLEECPNECGFKFSVTPETISFKTEQLENHLETECEKTCRKCFWEECEMQISPQDLKSHYNDHLATFVTKEFLDFGEHEFIVPVRATSIKVTVWGGGGAAGIRYQNDANLSTVYCNGGNGDTVQCSAKVYPKETLYIVVASGGYVSSNKKNESTDLESSAGFPCGGEGKSLDLIFCGGGGGCSYISRLTENGYALLALAAGGGGGGTYNRKVSDGAVFKASNLCGKSASSLHGGLGGVFGGRSGQKFQGAESVRCGGGGGGGINGGGSGGYLGGRAGTGGSGSSFGEQVNNISKILKPKAWVHGLPPGSGGTLETGGSGMGGAVRIEIQYGVKDIK